MFMEIGHILLSGNDAARFEHFVRLTEGIDRLGIRQHVIVASHELAARVGVYGGVTLGPAIQSAVMAMVLMPDVTLVHAHDDEAGRAALLMNLTRSIPYVLTHREPEAPGWSPVRRSIYARAETIIASTAAAAESLADDRIETRIAEVADVELPNIDFPLAEHVRAYRQAVDRLSVPTMLL